MSACAASVVSMNACDSGKPVWRRYFAYARSTTISSAGSRAASTSRLKSSFSTSPRKTRANASSNTACSASISTSASATVDCMPKSCIHTGSASCGAIRCGRSSITLSPIRSSIGRLSDNGTGRPRWKSLKRSTPGPASSGR